MPNLVSAPSVVRDNFLLCNSIANVLINTGISHSFILSAFASALGLEVARLASPLRVESPIGEDAVLDQGCRGCEIEVVGCRLPFTFTLINMLSFDVILGIDWLLSYWAIIDCSHQKVTVCMSSSDYFYFLGDRIGKDLLLVCDPYGWVSLVFFLLHSWGLRVMWSE